MNYSLWIGLCVCCGLLILGLSYSSDESSHLQDRLDRTTFESKLEWEFFDTSKPKTPTTTPTISTASTTQAITSPNNVVPPSKFTWLSIDSLQMNSPSDTAGSWHLVPYFSHTHGFDAHLVPKGHTVLECRSWSNGSIEMRGVIECYENEDDCFIFKGWEFPKFDVAGTLPKICRPQTVQHVYMRFEDTKVEFPGPPLLVQLFPHGEVKVEVGLGSLSWKAFVSGVSSLGEGVSHVSKALASPPYQPKVVGLIKRPLPPRPLVAIAIPMTSRKLNLKSVGESPLIKIVVPSLKKHLGSDMNDFEVVVYAGFDTTDPFWPTVNVSETVIQVSKASLSFKIKYIKCDCSSMVCNSNCILKLAYDDGAEFFFRINDDSEFVKGDQLITKHVDVLKSFTPPYVGVVGPSCRQGKLSILTHDFVHRSHMELFNMNYYPTILSNWWCDDWISLVYGATNTAQTPHVEILHHPRVSRYGVSFAIKDSGAFNKMLRESRSVVKTYLDARAEG